MQFERNAHALPTYKLLRAMVVIFTLMISYPCLPGAESEFFRGFSLFVGATVTVGLTAAIGNLVSGVILTYTGSFRIGDRVGIGDSAGKVIAKTLFVTRVRTIENRGHHVPERGGPRRKGRQLQQGGRAGGSPSHGSRRPRLWRALVEDRRAAE